MMRQKVYSFTALSLMPRCRVAQIGSWRCRNCRVQDNLVWRLGLKLPRERPVFTEMLARDLRTGGCTACRDKVKVSQERKDQLELKLRKKQLELDISQNERTALKGRPHSLQKTSHDNHCDSGTVVRRQVPSQLPGSSTPTHGRKKGGKVGLTAARIRAAIAVALAAFRMIVPSEEVCCSDLHCFCLLSSGTALLVLCSLCSLLP